MSSVKNSRQAEFTVVIPAYNAEDTIAETLDSLRQQTVQNFEVIIVDDGSTDGTRHLAEAFVSSEDRFRIVSKPNGGTADAYNHGIKRVSTPWVVMLSADDLLAPSHMSSLGHAAEQCDADCALITTAGWYLYPSGKEELATPVFEGVRPGTLEQMISERFFAMGGAFTTEAWRSVDGFDRGLYAEDWFFFLCVAAEGFKWSRIGAPSAYHRVSEVQKSQRGLIMREADLSVLERLNSSYSLSGVEESALREKQKRIKRTISQRRALYFLFGEKRAEQIITKVRRP